jgi:hypothetical protein
MSEQIADLATPNVRDSAAFLNSRRKLELIVILSTVVAMCSVASHLAIHWLGVRTGAVGYHHYGAERQKAETALFGSSLAYDGLDWQRICQLRGGAIESWATPGSSPAEWEVHQKRSTATTRAFVVVSAYDLNEHWLCDFRADIVPLKRTLGDLWQCQVDWEFRKRILSQYAMMCVRKFFPTVGRSDGVMTGVRDKIMRMLGRSLDGVDGDAPKFGFTDNITSQEKVTTWSAGHQLRRLTLMRIACQGKHSYNGPKKLALARLLEQADRQGEVLLIVMPVSPIYHKEFLGKSEIEEFETELADMQKGRPKLKVVRLDQIPSLRNDEMYRDFVHLNMFGNQIATAAFLNRK